MQVGDFLRLMPVLAPDRKHANLWPARGAIFPQPGFPDEILNLFLVSLPFPDRAKVHGQSVNQSVPGWGLLLPKP